MSTPPQALATDPEMGVAAGGKMESCPTSGGGGCQGASNGDLEGALNRGRKQLVRRPIQPGSHSSTITNKV